MRRSLLHLTMDDFAGKSAAYYDTVAESYDDLMAATATSSLARDAFRQLVLSSVPSGALLDFGCGTGTDAIWFAERGFRVLAYDNSSRMIERTRAKGAKLIEQGVLTTQASTYQEFLSSEPERSFDAVISNFGVLSHVEDLAPLLQAFSRRLAGDGCLIANVLNPLFWKDMSHGWWWKSARDSFGTGMLRVSAGEIETYRHFPSRIIEAASPWFSLRKMAGVGTLLRRNGPTHDWRRPKSLAERVDKACWTTFPFCMIGQHLFLVFERRT